MDEDYCYMKIIAPDEIYNFLSSSYLFGIINMLRKIIKCFGSILILYKGLSAYKNNIFSVWYNINIFYMLKL